MSSDYIGTIIEESLEKLDVLSKLKVVKQNIEIVTEHHNTPWIKQWTLDKVEILEENAENIA